MKNFNKATVTALLMQELSLSREQSKRVYDLLGQELANAIDSGGVVRVFGVGTLKLVKKRWTDAQRLRFRPSPQYADQALSGRAGEDGNDGDEG